MDRLILAHDLGTSADKATLFGEDGTLIGSASHPYPANFLPDGRAEQDPELWWRAAVAATRNLLEGRDASRIAAIAVSGTMMGCLCVDRGGKPLRPHILYCDQRSTAQTERFIERAGEREIYRVSGNRPSPSYTAAKCMWVRENEPDVYRNIHKVVNSKDYLNFRLTGRIATDHTDASGSNLYDLATGCWSEKLMAAAGLDLEKFPDIVPSAGVLGELTREAALAMGLPVGIPVMGGSGDGMCASVGVGSISPGRPYACVGSSAWIAVTTTEPIHDSAMRTITFAHAVPGLFNPMGIMQVGGGNYVWLKSEVCREEAARAEKEGRSAYEAMSESASSSPPGANRLLFLPYLMGERTPHWNPLARGGFVGLTMTHTRADLIRAVLEGVTYNLATIIDIFRGVGIDLKDMVMVGGGAKGALWRQITADVFDLDVLKPNHLDEATSIGAAIIAGVGSGIFPGFSVADRFVKIVDRAKPIREHQPAYRRNRALFDKVYKALEPLFPDFAI